MMFKNKLSLLITTFLLITLCSTLSAMDYADNDGNTEQQKYVMKDGEAEKLNELDELNSASDQDKYYMILNKILRYAAKNDLQQVIITLLSRPEVSKNKNILSKINRTVFIEAAQNGHLNHYQLKLVG